MNPLTKTLWLIMAAIAFTTNQAEPKTASWYPSAQTLAGHTLHAYGAYSTLLAGRYAFLAQATSHKMFEVHNTQQQLAHALRMRNNPEQAIDAVQNPCKQLPIKRLSPYELFQQNDLVNDLYFDYKRFVASSIKRGLVGIVCACTPTVYNWLKN